jgi:hypothetical protein
MLEDSDIFQIEDYTNLQAETPSNFVFTASSSANSSIPSSSTDAAWFPTNDPLSADITISSATDVPTNDDLARLMEVLGLPLCLSNNMQLPDHSNAMPSSEPTTCQPASSSGNMNMVSFRLRFSVANTQVPF